MCIKSDGYQIDDINELKMGLFLGAACQPCDQSSPMTLALNQASVIVLLAQKVRESTAFQSQKAKDGTRCSNVF